jgi:hypothetical protein
MVFQLQQDMSRLWFEWAQAHVKPRKADFAAFSAENYRAWCLSGSSGWLEEQGDPALTALDLRKFPKLGLKIS